jgi:hypothetical protein
MSGALRLRCHDARLDCCAGRCVVFDCGGPCPSSLAMAQQPGFANCSQAKYQAPAMIGGWKDLLNVKGVIKFEDRDVDFAPHTAYLGLYGSARTYGDLHCTWLLIIRGFTPKFRRDDELPTPRLARRRLAVAPQVVRCSPRRPEVQAG